MIKKLGFVFTVLAAVISALLAVHCSSDAAKTAPPRKVKYVTTIPPLKMILSELTGERGEVISLLQAGSSPHTYEPEPSDVKTIEKSNAFFFVHVTLDGWSSKFDSSHKVEILNLIPSEYIYSMDEHAHEPDHHHAEGEPDAHFWHDPLTVKALLPNLVKKLSEIDPDGATIYKSNADSFASVLDALHDEIKGKLDPYRGNSVLLFHPAWNYFLNRYGLVSAGSIEPFPGREPSPKYIVNLLKIVKEKDVKAIFTEPQLSKSAVNTLKNETGLPVYIIDPLGGYEGRETYSDLLLYNAGLFEKALKGGN